MTISIVAFLPKNSYLTEVVNEKIQIFQNAGLINLWDERSKNAVRSASNEDKSPFAVLAMRNLNTVFLTYVLATIVSILVFIGENAYSNVKPKSIKFRNNRYKKKRTIRNTVEFKDTTKRVHSMWLN